jgi:nucleoside-diphosphate kinase
LREIIIIKPDGVERGLVGEILKRFEKYGFRIVGLKILNVSKKQAEELYEVHKGKPFYNDLIEYICSGPVVAGMLQIAVPDADSVSLVRKIVGETDPAKAAMGTIRGDFGVSIRRNIIHASDSRPSRDREMKIFFSDEELVDYPKN